MKQILAVLTPVQQVIRSRPTSIDSLRCSALILVGLLGGSLGWNLGLGSPTPYGVSDYEGPENLGIDTGNPAVPLIRDA